MSSTDDWDQYLTRLEVELAEPFSGVPLPELEPPRSALPVEFAGRAIAVANTLGEKETEYERARLDAAEQLAAIAKVPAARADTAVYIDVSG